MATAGASTETNAQVRDDVSTTPMTTLGYSSWRSGDVQDSVLTFVSRNEGISVQAQATGPFKADDLAKLEDIAAKARPRDYQPQQGWVIDRLNPSAEAYFAAFPWDIVKILEIDFDVDLEGPPPAVFADLPFLAAGIVKARTLETLVMENMPSNFITTSMKDTLASTLQHIYLEGIDDILPQFEQGSLPYLNLLKMVPKIHVNFAFDFHTTEEFENLLKLTSQSVEYLDVKLKTRPGEMRQSAYRDHAIPTLELPRLKHLSVIFDDRINPNLWPVELKLVAPVLDTTKLTPRAVTWLRLSSAPDGILATVSTLDICLMSLLRSCDEVFLSTIASWRNVKKLALTCTCGPADGLGNTLTTMQPMFDKLAMQGNAPLLEEVSLCPDVSAIPDSTITSSGGAMVSLVAQRKAMHKPLARLFVSGYSFDVDSTRYLTANVPVCRFESI